MKIEKIKIENYKVYRNTEIRDLSNFSVFLGANGAGKSTLFDVFGFLSDALKANVKPHLTKEAVTGKYIRVTVRGPSFLK